MTEAHLFGSHHLKYSDTVRCPRCHRTGTIEWEAAAEKNLKELVRINGEFYERVSKKPPFPIELVCVGCGTPQPAPVQP
jgi:hypothetical protein